MLCSAPALVARPAARSEVRRSFEVFSLTLLPSSEHHVPTDIRRFLKLISAIPDRIGRGRHHRGPQHDERVFEHWQAQPYGF
jgi:hypothetical protein